MVCDEAKEGWVPAINSAYMLGLALGSVLFGLMSDKLGRRKTLFVAIITSISFSVIASLSDSYKMYVGMRFLVGAGAEGW